MVPANTQRMFYIFEGRPLLRVVLLEALLAFVTSPKATRMPAFLQKAAVVFELVSNSREESLAEIGKRGVNFTSRLFRPSMPPHPSTQALVTWSLPEGPSLPVADTTQSADGDTVMDQQHSRTSTPPLKISKSSDAIGTSSQVEHQAAEVAPSASALATDFEDGISGPAPIATGRVGRDETPQQKRQRRRSENPVEPATETAARHHPKRQKKQSPSGTSANSRDTPNKPSSSLIVKPYEAKPSNTTAKVQQTESPKHLQSATKSKRDKSMSSSTSPGTLYVRATKAPKNDEMDTGIKKKTPQALSETASKNERSPTPQRSPSPGGRRDSMLTVDTSDMPTPSAGDFFKDDAGISLSTPSQGVLAQAIDPSLLGQVVSSSSTTSNAESQPVPDSDDDDAPIPQIVDGVDFGMDSEEDEGTARGGDNRGAEDTEMAAGP